MERYRDPLYGFIEVSDGENRIIDSAPFLRLRNIKQLGMTDYVYYGAEHTRFSHSIGVMHLVTRAFRSAVGKGMYIFPEPKKKWYEQILRLIALTHDLGHAPFSHASESVFPNGLEHEDYTEKIIKETCISEYINGIGRKFTKRYGADYDITAELLCDIYAGRNPGEHSEFNFLQSFMDSELDCDKMDYLLRDSLYCGVNYGKYDLERLISSLTVYVMDDAPHLAIESGGIQAFEEFVLARYFMFVEVYFHRTRRYLDIMLSRALTKILPEEHYPIEVSSYLEWDDCRVMQLIKQNQSKFEECNNIVKRKIYTKILNTPTHPQAADIREYKSHKRDIKKEFQEDIFLEDSSAGKMHHKIPIKTSIEDEKAIVIVDRKTGKITTISEESHIIRCLSDKINIIRLYVKPDYKEEVLKYVQSIYKEVN